MKRVRCFGGSQAASQRGISATTAHPSPAHPPIRPSAPTRPLPLPLPTSSKANKILYRETVSRESCVARRFADRICGGRSTRSFSIHIPALWLTGQPLTTSLSHRTRESRGRRARKPYILHSHRNPAQSVQSIAPHVCHVLATFLARRPKARALAGGRLGSCHSQRCIRPILGHPPHLCWWCACAVDTADTWPSQGRACAWLTSFGQCSV